MSISSKEITSPRSTLTWTLSESTGMCLLIGGENILMKKGNEVGVAAGTSFVHQQYL